MKAWTAAALGTVLLAALGTGVVYATRTAAKPDTVTIQGDISVPTGNASSSICVSGLGYTDIAAGAQVTITDQAHAVIHTGSLNAGEPTAGRCVYHFRIDGVPAAATTYGVSIGNTFRGVIYFTRDQLASPIALTLG